MVIENTIIFLIFAASKSIDLFRNPLVITNSDVLSIHVQGGERYKDCITIKEFDKMKKTAFLINTSRGPIVNEDDLIIALSTNVIAGAGIDVYDKEPLQENNKLRFLPNALLTPHIGYVTAVSYTHLTLPTKRIV